MQNFKQKVIPKYTFCIKTGVFDLNENIPDFIKTIREEIKEKNPDIEIIDYSYFIRPINKSNDKVFINFYQAVNKIGDEITFKFENQPSAHVLSCAHNPNYPTIDGTYSDLFDYLDVASYKINGNIREVYTENGMELQIPYTT